MKPRSGKAMVARPYVPDSVGPATGNRHPVVRRLGPSAIGDPAIVDIKDAADELASALGKTPYELTDSEVDQAIQAGRERFRDT